MGKSKVKKWTLLYTEISKLGEGGNADVYLVEDNKSGFRYALKELRSNNRSEEKKSRFISEIQIARDKVRQGTGGNIYDCSGDEEKPKAGRRK